MKVVYTDEALANLDGCWRLLGRGISVSGKHHEQMWRKVMQALLVPLAFH